MGFNDLSQFPRGIYQNDLGSDRDVALAAFSSTSASMKVAWFLFSNDNAAAQTVLVTDTDDNTLMTVVIPPDTTIEPLPGFYNADGLKVAMGVNTADVEFSVVYWDAS
jgi:hypothetical protein